MHPRIRTEGRTDLSKVIPLDTPIHLFIDPSAACNFRCKFCFNHKISHHEIMPMGLFKKVIDDCKGFPHKIKALRLYGFGEPLLNRNLPEMIRYAKESGVTDFVEFTTNGWALNEKLSSELVGAGLDAITISLPGMNAQKIVETTGRAVKLEHYIEIIKYLYSIRGKCRVHVKITNYDLSEQDKRKFCKIFGEIADEISIDNIVPIWPEMNTGIKDQTKNIYNLPINEVKVCPYIFYHATIHANGDVSTCFTDWAHKNIIGNVNKENLVDVWNGEKLRKICMEQLCGIKKGICNDCGQLKYGQADDIGDHKKILERMMGVNNGTN